jgi:archaellum biogenesis protein FlaJ (TadC family)
MSDFILLIISISLVTITEARTHTQATSISRLVLALILPQIAFGFTLSSFSVKVRRPSRKPVIEKPSDTTTEITITRRAFLRAVIAAVVAIPIIYLGLNRLFPTQEVQIPSTSPASLLPPQSRSKAVGFNLD